MKTITRQAFILGLVLLLCISCNLPLASLFSKSDKENSSDTGLFEGDEDSGGGWFSGGSEGKTGQNNGKEKPLTGSLEVVNQAFWPYHGENEVILAVLVKNTDPKLTVFHPEFKFKMLDPNGQDIFLEETLSMRLEDGSNQFPDVVLYPGQEFFYCEVARLGGRLATDLDSLVVTPASKPKGVDLGITSNPITADRTTLTNLGDVYNGQLQSGVILNNARDRIAFMPVVTTAGFDAGGNIINCGRESGTPHFIRGNDQAASTFRMFNNQVPVSVQSFAAQEPSSYYLQDKTWEIQESNQLTLSGVSFVQDDLDLLPIYTLTNNHKNSGQFNVSINIFAYDANGDVAGAASSRYGLVFAPGTTYGPYHYLQKFMIPGKQAATLKVDVVTYDVYKTDYELPVSLVEYSPPSYDLATGNIITQVTSHSGETIFAGAVAACFDAGHNLIGYGWNSGYFEANSTTPFSLYGSDIGGNNCSSASTIEVNTSFANLLQFNE